MSISSELTLLANTKESIRTSINNKGGSVGANDTFASYATAIDNLPSGGGGNKLLTSIDVSDFTGTTFNRATSYITDVTIPNTVTSIENYAFQNCSSLTSITIPSGVANIGQYSFQNCSSLSTVNFPSGSLTIGSSAFYGLSSLSTVNVSSLEDWFQKTFTLGTYDSSTSGNPLYNQSATLYANGTAVTGHLSIPNSVTSIPDAQFNYYAKITSVNIHNSVTSIGTGAFYQCTGLTGKLTIPNSVTTINKYAFYGCTGLTSVEIGSGVTSFGYSILQGCTGLTSITITATTPPTLSSGAFDNTNNCPIYVPAASVATYQSASGWSSYSSRIQEIPE